MKVIRTAIQHLGVGLGWVVNAFLDGPTKEKTENENENENETVVLRE